MTNEQLVGKIEEVFQEIRPNIQMDGGDIEFVSFNDGIVSVRLLGACTNCPLSSYTLKLGVEERLKEQVSEVVEVVTVE